MKRNSSKRSVASTTKAPVGSVRELAVTFVHEESFHSFETSTVAPETGAPSRCTRPVNFGVMRTISGAGMQPVKMASPAIAGPIFKKCPRSAHHRPDREQHRAERDADRDGDARA